MHVRIAPVGKDRDYVAVQNGPYNHGPPIGQYSMCLVGDTRLPSRVHESRVRLHGHVGGRAVVPGAARSAFIRLASNRQRGPSQSKLHPNLRQFQSHLKLVPTFGDTLPSGLAGESQTCRPHGTLCMGDPAGVGCQPSGPQIARAWCVIYIGNKSMLRTHVLGAITRKRVFSKSPRRLASCTFGQAGAPVSALSAVFFLYMTSCLPVYTQA